MGPPNDTTGADFVGATLTPSWAVVSKSLIRRMFRQSHVGPLMVRRVRIYDNSVTGRPGLISLPASLTTIYGDRGSIRHVLFRFEPIFERINDGWTTRNGRRRSPMTPLL